MASLESPAAALDPSAFFQGHKALRFCRAITPKDAPPFSNSLALVAALESQQTCVRRQARRGARRVLAPAP